MSKRPNLMELNKENISRVFGIDFEKKEFTLKNIIDKQFLRELGLKQAIIYNYDTVISADIKDITIDFDNIIEARFFNEEIEVRIYNDEEEIKGSIFIERPSENQGEEYIEEKFILYDRNNEGKYAKSMKVRKYIDYDEDNQAYVYYTKPYSLIFGGES